MKLTTINIKNGDVAKVEVEMTAQEFYRISDTLRADAERGGDFSKLTKKMTTAVAAQSVEKQILKTFEAAQTAKAQGIIKSIEGQFAAADED